MLTWLPDVIANAGLTVKVEPGWNTHGYAFTGPVRGIIAHHTATPATAPGDYPSLRVVRDGRSDLAGPLSQLGLGRSGTVYILAAGRANHAGSGSYPGLSGNADTIGIEAEHPGVISYPWPVAQLAAYYRLCAALLDHLDLPVDRLIGHKEWTSRKVDPIGLNMDKFRSDVQSLRRRPNMFLPLSRDDATARKSDVAAIAYLLNAAYGTSLPGDGSWPSAMSDTLRSKLGENGEFITGKMYAKLIIDVAKAQGGGGTVDNSARAAITKLRNHLRQS